MITLDTGLGGALSQGDTISGIDVDGNAITASAYSSAAIGDTVIKIKYKTSDNQDNHVGCYVGALPATE